LFTPRRNAQRVETGNDAHHDQAVDSRSFGFKECHALQCGFCTPGMVMNILSRFEERKPLDLSESGIRDMLSGNLCRFEERKPLDLSESGIRDMLSGNLCRCTGYINIIAAVRRAAELLGRE
jgi:aerobic-type carbon monoxide dehydrogenase small subunit (CoxS/CutS family)